MKKETLNKIEKAIELVNQATYQGNTIELIKQYPYQGNPNEKIRKKYIILINEIRKEIKGVFHFSYTQDVMDMYLEFLKDVGEGMIDYTTKKNDIWNSNRIEIIKLLNKIENKFNILIENDRLFDIINKELDKIRDLKEIEYKEIEHLIIEYNDLCDVFRKISWSADYFYLNIKNIYQYTHNDKKPNLEQLLSNIEKFNNKKEIEQEMKKEIEEKKKHILNIIESGFEFLADENTISDLRKYKEWVINDSEDADYFQLDDLFGMLAALSEELKILSEVIGRVEKYKNQLDFDNFFNNEV